MCITCKAWINFMLRHRLDNRRARHENRLRGGALTMQEVANGAPRTDDFLVVGAGASAGGLEPLERLFAAMPNPCGMAFVVLQHLSPDFESRMDELLGRQTSLTIHKVTDGIEVEADHIYLIPPKKE